MKLPFWRQRSDRELEEEVEGHLRMSAADKVDRGESSDEALISARRELGNVALIKEVTRGAWGLLWLERLVQDVRYGIRVLRKSPVFTIVAILTLALGIGANTAIFTLVNAFVLRPLAVADPASLFSVASVSPQGPGLGTFSYPNYKDIRDRNDVLTGISARSFIPITVTFGGETERVIGNAVSANYFDVLGVKAAIGRTFLPEEEQTATTSPVVVVSHGCWKRRYGGDPQIVGHTIVLNNHNFTAIGIAPEEFTGSDVAFAPEFWVLSNMESWFTATRISIDQRDDAKWMLVGRLKPGVSQAHAEASLNAIVSELGKEFPDDNEGLAVQLVRPGFVIPAARGPVLGFAGLMMITVGLVLLISCSNLAGLLLSRMTERRREIAIRLALGAGRRRLVRQLLTESLLLSVAGGALGLLAAMWLTGLATALLPKLQFSVTFHLEPDWRVLSFTLIVSILAGVLFGLVPALQGTKADLSVALKNETSTGGHSISRLRSWLIVTQVALSFVLLISAGVIIRSLQHAQEIGPGFETEHAIAMSVSTTGQGYTRIKGLEFYRLMVANVRSLPGVKEASLTSYLPLSLDYYGSSVLVEGQPPARGVSVPEAMKCSIAQDYFSTMSIPIVAGRDFTAEDKEDSTLVAIVNETFAKRFWPGQNAIGKRFTSETKSPFITVVGIVRDAKYFNISEDPRTFFYRPLSQAYHGEAVLVVRTTNQPDLMLATVKHEVRKLDATVPVYDLKTLTEHMRLSTFPLRVGANGVGTFGLLALILATIGIYGGVAYAVSQRTKEIGIRMAIGATRTDIFKLIIRDGLTVSMWGLAIGLVAGVVVSRLISGFIYGIGEADLTTFAVVSLLFIVVVLAACCIPARRATTVDPMTALRHE